MTRKLATTPAGRPRVGEAVVLGAGLGGLTTAASLAGRAEHVTVLDRDAIPRVDEPRDGVPQGRHVHLLLPGGMRVLARLMPGLERSFRDAGAQILRDPDDFAVHLGGGRLAVERLDPAFVLIGATRPLIEGVVRERVRALPNVRLIGGTHARGPVRGPNGSVAGVRVRRTGRAATDEAIAADLVVDATGRGSRAPAWLRELGFDAPEEESVPVDLRYVTRLFRRQPGRGDGPRNVLIGAPPGDGRGAVALAVENDRWIVSLIGMLGRRPPSDLEGFRAYARSLWCGDVHAITSSAEPVGEAATFSFPANVRRRYDRLRRFPGGFVVLGDALGPFNPAYGQGMSMAAIEAETLGVALDRVGCASVGPAFFGAIRSRIEDVFTQAVDNDLRHPEVEGPRTLRWRILDRYAQRLLPLAHRDPLVGRAFLDVMCLLAPGSSLMRPRVAARVLLHGGPREAGPVAPAG